MISLTIAPELTALVPGIAVGWLTAQVQVIEHSPELWSELETAANRYRGIVMDDARQLAPIKALRTAYRTLGNDPTRYRGSNEASVRRISQGKDLYRVNSVVDVNNLITLETLHSAGTFDAARLEPPVVFRIGQPGESYAGIGRGLIKIENLPVFADQQGPFGSNTSDSERSMVKLTTTRILMVVISFLGAAGMPETMQRAAALLERYTAGRDIETGVVQ